MKLSSCFTMIGMHGYLSTFLIFAAIGCGHKTLIVSTNSMAPTPKGTTTSATDWPETRSAAELLKQKKAAGTANIPVDGIPFYVKRGSCKTETVWIEPQYTMTLSIILDEKGPEILEEGTLTRSGYLDPKSKQLVNFVSGIQGKHELGDKDLAACPQNVKNHWETVFPPSGSKDAPPILQYEAQPHTVNDPTASNSTTQPNPVEAAEAAGNLIRAINTASVVPVVDYTHVYYMNGKTPWIGSSQVDAKLADDGTLSEGSGQAEDDTWSTILNTITGLVGDFTGATTAASAASTPAAASPAVQPQDLTHVIVGSPKPTDNKCEINPPDWPTPQHSVTYTYKLTPTVYTHDHSYQTFDLVGGCSPAPGGVIDGSYTITKVSPDAGDGGKKNNTITLSGTVSLPDSKDAKGKDKKGSNQ